MSSKIRSSAHSNLSKAWVQYLLVALIVFVIPSIFGHPFASGDNLIQFNPLRVLAAKIERTGHLPLWDQYIWSGTPLLAGFNAGVFLPTSWLYLVLPSTAAWGFAQGLPYFLAAFGFYQLMKDLGVTDFSARVTGLVFAFAGVMIGQGVHLDMITGISMAPWMLLCASRIIRPSERSKISYAILLAICFAIVVLAGAPEAMLDEAIMLLVYSLARLIQVRTDWFKKLLWLAGAGLLALGLSAAQWVPGIEFQRISQRSTPSYAYVSFGAFAPQYFYSIFAPYLFGGPGATPIRGYYGPFTWEEVTIYPTVGPLIALFSTIGRTFKRVVESKLVPYICMAVIGTILALGSYTPLESLLYHIPLYGEQRLQGRNILTLNVAIFAFFAIWLDGILSKSAKRTKMGPWLSFLPALAVLVLYLAYFSSPGFLANFLHASTLVPAIPTMDVAIVGAISLAVALVSGLVYFVIQRDPRQPAKGLLLAIIALDLAVFNLFGGLGTATHLSQFTSSSKPITYLHSLIGHDSRFAIYDPQLYDFSQLNTLGEPDLNIGAGNHSIGGYSSLSLGNYETATQTHTQNSLNPPLLASPLMDTLGTKVIITNWHYLITQYGSSTAVPLPYFYLPEYAGSPSPPPVSAYPDLQNSNQQPAPTETSGLFGRTLQVSSIDVSVGHTFAASSVKSVGLLLSDGSINWLSPGAAVVPGSLHFSVNEGSGLSAIGVIVRQLLPTFVADPQKALVTGVGVNSTQGYFAIDGPLNSYLTFPHYRQIGTSGGLTLFENTQAKPILSPSAHVKIVNQHTELNGTLDMTVRASSNSTIYWAEAYAPGWKAEYSSKSGKSSMLLPTLPNGPLQKITVPAGEWQIKVFYHPSSVYKGILISSLSVLLTLLLTAMTVFRRHFRRRGNSDSAVTKGNSQTSTN